MYINDSKIFRSHSLHFGGTEYALMSAKMKFLDSMEKLNNYHCIILPGNLNWTEVFSNNKKVILWLHNPLDQFGEAFAENRLIIELMFNNVIKDKLKAVILVSETQKQILINKYPNVKNKVVVINNGIDKLKYDQNKFLNVDKPKIIHLSDKTRGLPILLKSLKYIDEDFSLKIFNDFDPIKHYDESYIESLIDERVYFYNFVPKRTVTKYIEEAHIHAYPSTFEETFCLSQAEAMSAGCLCVYSFDKNNAVKEISGNFGIGIDMNKISNFSEETISKVYAKELTNAIKIIKNKKFNPKKQIEYINSKYSWENIEKQWRKFYETL